MVFWPLGSLDDRSTKQTGIKKNLRAFPNTLLCLAQACLLVCCSPQPSPGLSVIQKGGSEHVAGHHTGRSRACDDIGWSTYYKAVLKSSVLNSAAKSHALELPEGRIS